MISRNGVRPSDSLDSSDEDISLDNCLLLKCQLVNGSPGFDNDEAFWAPIAYHTHGRLKSSDTYTSYSTPVSYFCLSLDILHL